jgi:hypothetical protein
MKRTNLLLSALSALVYLSGCIAMDPAMMNGGPGPGYGSNYGPGPSYGGSYSGGGYGHNDYHAPEPAYGSHGSYQGDAHEHRHQMQHNDHRWGGPDEWYASGKALGIRDRKARQSCNYARHRNHYDGNTREEFAHGYNDGYHGH